MIIGIPRERKILEKRIAVTLGGAHELVAGGHQVLIEAGAGAGSHFSDEEYRQAGCEVVGTLDEVWRRAELIVKVKEPAEEEYQFFREGLVIFDYLHLAGLPKVADALLAGKVTGIAYELVKTTDGRLPLLEPMSEVAGKLAVLNGCYYLLSQNGGRGVLLGGTVGVSGGDVVIVGAGVAGRAACNHAIGLGANVTVLDINYMSLEKVKVQFGNVVNTSIANRATLEAACRRADLLIGAVLIPGAAAPKIITRAMVQQMKRGAVFVDISIDQGGCGETMRTTSLKEPVYEEEGVIHYAVPNMPAQTPRTSTLALTAATLPFIQELANKGVEQALRESEQLRAALNTYKGKLTNKQVAEALQLQFVSPRELL